MKYQGKGLRGRWRWRWRRIKTLFKRLLYAIVKIAITTARIILHLILYPLFAYDLFHMHHSLTYLSREHMNPQLTGSQRQWLHSLVGRASHRYREVTGSSPVEVLNFFQASLRNCQNCDHNCEEGSFFILFHIRSSHMIYFICIIHLDCLRVTNMLHIGFSLSFEQWVIILQRP